MEYGEKKPKIWSFKELEMFYLETPDSILHERLLELLRWSKSQGAFIASKNVFPSFGIRGKHGRRIMSIWSPEKSHPSMPPGTIYIFINPKTKFNNRLEERNEYVEKLNQLGNMGFDDISCNIAGINSRGTLGELRSNEFSTFMSILHVFGYDKFRDR